MQGRRPVRMAVRTSPKKASVSAPAKPKRKTKTSGANQTGVAAARTLPFSTNVSSPIQAVSKRRKKASSVDDEAEAEQDAFDPPPRYANGYARDSFIVPDDEEDDDFVPVRETGKAKTKQKKGRELGPPITNDNVLDQLSESHRELVDMFVFNAHDQAKKIQQVQQLRQRPFSDTILRLMAINLCKDKQDLLCIPGIKSDMVERHGHVFITMLTNLKEAKGFPQDNSDGDQSEDEEEQRPMDPNHQNVIDLISDEEEDDEYGDDAFEDDDDDDEEDGPSPHFQMPAKPASVEKFNRDFGVAQATAGKKVVKPKNGGGGKKGGYKKNTGRGSGAGGGGSRKKYKNNKGGGGKRSSVGGGGGGGNTFRGGIGMMPV